MSPGRGAPTRYANLLTINRSWFASVGAMLWPSTRATWNPNVTISVAYTAADTSVLHPGDDLAADRSERDADDRCATPGRPRVLRSHAAGSSEAHRRRGFSAAFSKSERPVASVGS